MYTEVKDFYVKTSNDKTNKLMKFLAQDCYDGGGGNDNVGLLNRIYNLSNGFSFILI